MRNPTLRHLIESLSHVETSWNRPKSLYRSLSYLESAKWAVDIINLWTQIADP